MGIIVFDNVFREFKAFKWKFGERFFLSSKKSPAYIFFSINSQKIDEKSDELADQAYVSVKDSVSSAWRYAAGYATQMFTEEDLEAEALLGKIKALVLSSLSKRIPCNILPNQKENCQMLPTILNFWWEKILKAGPSYWL